MRLLVIGSNGQLALSLRQRAGDADLVALGRSDVDLGIPGSAETAITRTEPDVVINAAAYTAVDAAEAEPERAFRTNAEAAGEIACAAHQTGARLIHISTDYVFDGRATDPYAEDTRPHPLSVYGRSKLDGEMRVREEIRQHAIIRTAWLYSPFGKNFVKTMVSAARERNELRVVADQHGSPTSALDLADAVLMVARNPAGWGETYHVAGSGTASWFDVAQATMEQCQRLGLPAAHVEPITTADWPTPAKRPVNSALDCRKFERTYQHRMPDWRQSLPGVVEQIALDQQ